jgi:hypothetical protein
VAEAALRWLASHGIANPATQAATFSDFVSHDRSFRPARSTTITGSREKNIIEGRQN